MVESFHILFRATFESDEMTIRKIAKAGNAKCKSTVWTIPDFKIKMFTLVVDSMFLYRPMMSSLKKARRLKCRSFSSCLKRLLRITGKNKIKERVTASMQKPRRNVTFLRKSLESTAEVICNVNFSCKPLKLGFSVTLLQLSLFQLENNKFNF